MVIKHPPTAVDCGSLDAPSNGAVDTSSGTTFMMTATYTCDTGYSIVGSQSRTCGASGTSGATTLTDGVWSPAEPVCERMHVIKCLTMTDNLPPLSYSCPLWQSSYCYQ